MIKEHYTLTPVLQGRAYLFNSEGPKGVILKAIIFEEVEKGRYNLAFGDLIDGQIDDEVVSNNLDLVKVVGTVAKAIYLFFEDNPGAVIEIEGVDRKRQWLYNLVFKRHYKEIESFFMVKGLRTGKMERYDQEKEYEKFEVMLLKH